MRLIDDCIVHTSTKVFFSLQLMQCGVIFRPSLDLDKGCRPSVYSQEGLVGG